MGWDWLKKGINAVVPGDPFDPNKMGGGNGPNMTGYDPMPNNKMTESVYRDPDSLYGGDAAKQSANYNPWEAMSGAGLGEGPSGGYKYGGPSTDFGTKSLADTMGQYTSALHGPANTGTGTGPFSAGAGAGGNDMNMMEKAALAAQIAGVGLGAWGQYKEGKARDEDRKRAQEDHDRQLREREQSAKDLSPLLAKYLGQTSGG